MNSITDGNRETLGTNYEIRVRPVSELVVYRFWLQSVARTLLTVKKPLDKNPLIKCLRYKAPNKRRVVVVRSASRKRASFRNLMTCGRVWLCPVCAAKISEKRAAELQTAVTLWHRSYGFVFLVTYTMSHRAGQPLKDTVDVIQAAFRSSTSGRAWIAMVEKFGIAGSVRAIEVTHGDNGWHPHIHQLVFVYPMSDKLVREFETDMRAHWMHMLHKEGGDGIGRKAFDVVRSEGAVYDYIAKFGHPPENKHWTLERELAKAASKLGRKEGKTPVQLLDLAGQGDERAAKLWVEYAATMTRRQQLRWSPELRKLLKLEKEESDGEIAAQTPSDYEFFCALEDHHWKLVSRVHRDLRGELLQVIGEGDDEKLKAWCLSKAISLIFEDDEADNGTQQLQTKDNGTLREFPHALRGAQKSPGDGRKSKSDPRNSGSGK